MNNDVCRSIQNNNTNLENQGHCLLPIAQEDLPVEMHSMAVHGNHIYITGGYNDSQVYIYHLEIPENQNEDVQLKLIGSAESGSTRNTAITIFGGFVFTEGDEGLCLLDGR
jgi:hypothetical protein